MITTSDGEIYEDETAHALGVQMGGVSMQGRRAEPVTSNDEIVNREIGSEQALPTTDWGRKGILPKVGDLLDVEPSKNIVFGDKDPPMYKDIYERYLAKTDQRNNAADLDTRHQDVPNNPLSKALGVEDTQRQIDKAADRSDVRVKEKLEHFKKLWEEIPAPEK